MNIYSSSLSSSEEDWTLLDLLGGETVDLGGVRTYLDEDDLGGDGETDCSRFLDEGLDGGDDDLDDDGETDCSRFLDDGLDGGDNDLDDSSSSSNIGLLYEGTGRPYDGACCLS